MSVAKVEQNGTVSASTTFGFAHTRMAWSELDAMLVTSGLNGNNAEVAKIAFNNLTVVWRANWYTGTGITPRAVAAAPNGDIFVGGVSTVTVDLQGNNGKNDMFVAKVNRDTGARVWFRQFGANQDEEGEAVACDSSSNVYVLGNGRLSTGGNRDLIMVKLASDATELWSKQWGTSSNSDYARGLLVNGSTVYAVGNMGDALDGQTNPGGSSGGVTAWSTAGTKLWSRMVGTTGTDSIDAVCVSGSQLMAAGTTKGAFAGFTSSGNTDAFLAEIDVVSPSVVNTRQVGTSGDETVPGVACGYEWVILGGGTNGAFSGFTNPGGANSAYLINTRTRCRAGYAGFLCEPCDMGSYSIAGAQQTCTLCPAGKFGNTSLASSADSCYSCGPNAYAAAGSAACTQCAPGKLANATIADYATESGTCFLDPSTASPDFCVVLEEGGASGSQGQVDGVVRSFVVQARNGLGNNMTDSSTAFTATLTQTQNGNTVVVPVTFQDVDASQGIERGQYNATVSGTYEMTIRASGFAIRNATLVTFSAGPVDSSRTEVWGPGLGETTAGESGVVYVGLRDRFGNNLTDWAAAVVSSMGAVSVSSTPSATAGQFVLTYNATLSGTYALQVSVNGTAAPGSPFSVSVVAGATSSIASEVIGSPQGSVRAGALGEVRVQLRDAFGNNRTGSSEAGVLSSNDVALHFAGSGLGVYVGTFNVTVVGTYGVDVRVKGAQAVGSPVSVTIVSTRVSVARVTPANRTVGAGDGATWVLSMQDVFGNNITNAGVVEAWLQQSGGVRVNGTVSGAQAETLTANATVAGLYSMRVRVYDAEVQASGTTTVVAGPAVGSQTQLLNTSAVVTQLLPPDGVSRRFTLKTRDVYGNPTEATVTSFLSGDTTGTSALVFEYLGQGVYSVLVNITDFGNFNLNVTVNGVVVAGSPFLFTLAPGQPVLQRVEPNVAPIGGGTTLEIIGRFFIGGSQVVISRGEGANETQAAGCTVVAEDLIRCTAPASPHTSTYATTLRVLFNSGSNETQAIPFTFYKPGPLVNEARSGPASGGGTRLAVRGQELPLGANKITCVYNVSSGATWTGTGSVVNSTVLECVTPTFGGVVRSGIRLYVSLDGQVFVAQPATLTTYAMSVTSFAPAFVPKWKSVRVRVQGTGLQTLPELARWQFVAAGPSGQTLELRKALPSNGSSVVELDLPSFDSMTAFAAGTVRQLSIRVAPNGEQFLADTLVAQLYQEHGVSSVSPSAMANNVDGLTVDLAPAAGQLFVDTLGAARVSVAPRNLTLNATFVSTSVLRVTMPALNASDGTSLALRVALNGEEYTPANVSMSVFRLDTARPTWGPLSGNTLVTMRGVGFVQPVPGQVLCRFGSSLAAVSATIASASEITCRTPDVGLQTGSEQVFVTLNGQQFVTSDVAAMAFSAPPTFTSIEPARVAENLPQDLILHGTGFVNASVIVVRVDSVGDLIGERMDATRIRVPLPSIAQGSYVVRLSLNDGVQFVTTQYTLTVVRPVLTAMQPLSGPEQGGTVVTLTGTGFVAHPITGRVRVCVGNATADVIPQSETTVVLSTMDLRNQVPESMPRSQLAKLSVDVSTNVGGNVTQSGTYFEVYRVPVMDTVAPTSTRAAGGITLTLTGEYAQTRDATRVRFNVTSPGLQWLSDPVAAMEGTTANMTVVTPMLPIGALETVDTSLLVALNGQNYVRMPLSLLYFQNVAVQQIGRALGPTNMETEVALFGTNMLGLPTLTARFGGQETRECRVLTRTEMRCVTPALPDGLHTVEIATNGVDFTSCSGVRYSTASPRVRSVSPQSVPVVGGTVLTIVGAQLLNSSVGNSMLLRLRSNETGAVVQQAVALRVDDDGSQMEVQVGALPLTLVSSSDVERVHLLSMAVSTDSGRTFTPEKPMALQVYSTSVVNATWPHVANGAGSTVVSVRGVFAQLRDTPQVELRDGAGWSVRVAAERVGTSTLRVAVPPYGGTLARPVVVKIWVANNGQQLYPTPSNLTLHDTVVVSGISPTRKQPGDAVAVTILGDGFVVGAPVVRVRFGDEVFTQVRVVDEGTLVVQTPSTQARGTFPPEVSFDDGQTWEGKAEVTFTVFPVPVECPTGTRAYKNDGPEFLSDCECSPGFYHPQRERGKACTPCPPNAVCEGQGALPLALPGYFPVGSGTQFQFTRCAVESACLGGNGTNCGDGYQGRLCGQCTDRFYKLGDSCQACQQESSMFLLLLAGAFVLYLSWVRGEARHAQKRSGRVVSLAVTHLQVMSTFADFRLSWPDSVRTVFGYFSIVNFNLDAAAPECSLQEAWTYETRFWVTIMMPVVVLLGILLRVALQAIHAWCVNTYMDNMQSKRLLTPQEVRRPSHVSKEASQAQIYMLMAKDKIVEMMLDSENVSAETMRYVVNEVVFTTLILYITLCSRVLEVFDCVEVSQGLVVMNALPDEECWVAGGVHMRLVPAASVFLVLYVLGIPALALGIMYRGRDERYRLSPDFQQRFSTLFSRYRMQFYFFEGFVLLRKAAVVGINLYGASQPVLQGLMGIVLLGTAAVMQFRFRPYRTSLQNNLESTLYVLSLLLLVGGVMFAVGDLTAQGLESWTSAMVTVAVLALVVCAGYLVVDFYRNIAAWQRRWRAQAVDDVDERARAEHVLQLLSKVLRADHVHEAQAIVFAKTQLEWMEQVEEALETALQLEEEQVSLYRTEHERQWTVLRPICERAMISRVHSYLSDPKEQGSEARVLLLELMEELQRKQQTGGVALRAVERGIKTLRKSPSSVYPSIGGLGSETPKESEKEQRGRNVLRLSKSESVGNMRRMPKSESHDGVPRRVKGNVMGDL